MEKIIKNSKNLSFESPVLSCLHIDKSLPKFEYDAVHSLPADKNLYLLFTLANFIYSRRYAIIKFCILINLWKIADKLDVQLF
ncbi:hypothetical protein T06_632 [Trichinella sp. T6]|nr:hypothetical protein T06_632 [Trichinella sp. T6]